MSASAWQRLAPPAPGLGRSAIAGEPDLDDVLAVLDAYLQEPGTKAALDRAEAIGEYPRVILAELRARNLAELLLPTRATGPHVGALNAVMARRSGSLAITVGVNVLALLPVMLGGSDELCALAACRLRAGEAAAMLLTELPHGSNLLRNDAAATAGGDGFRLRGEKHLINGGAEHEMLVSLMRTRRSPADRPLSRTRDFSLFLVDRDASTVALPRLRTLPTQAADISGVRFDDTPVSRDRMVGPEGGGFPLVQKTLKLSHAGIGALASGAVSGALDLALGHARTRDIYGGPIVGLGAIAEHCARMAALDVVVAALAVKAAWLVGRLGAGAGYFSAAAKYACCRLAEEAVDEGRLVLGARALLADQPYARFIRDVPLYGVFDGTSHVMLDDLSWFLPRFAAARPGSTDALGLLDTAFGDVPRTIRETADLPWRPVTPPLTARCAGLADVTGDPAAARLAELADSLDEVVRALRSAGVWDADQSIRFEAAAVLAELEALLAAAELTLPGGRARFGFASIGQCDQDAARYAVTWLGDRIAGRLAHLVSASVGTAPSSAAMAARSRLLAWVAAPRDELAPAEAHASVTGEQW